MENPTHTPKQVAARLRELADEIKTQAFPRHQMAEGFKLMADLLAPAEEAGDTTGHA